MLSCSCFRLHLPTSTSPDTGRLESGEVFDSSHDRGEPIEFGLGKAQAKLRSQMRHHLIAAEMHLATDEIPLIT